MIIDIYIYVCVKAELTIKRRFHDDFMTDILYGILLRRNYEIIIKTIYYYRL